MLVGVLFSEVVEHARKVVELLRRLAQHAKHVAELFCLLLTLNLLLGAPVTLTLLPLGPQPCPSCNVHVRKVCNLPSSEKS